jgi:hypothetical protein
VLTEALFSVNVKKNFGWGHIKEPTLEVIYKKENAIDG